jgi:hypothetical protein
MPPTMKTLAILLGLVAAAPVAGAGQRHGDQMSAYAQHRAGRILSLPEIERRVVPTMKGAQYIGMAFDGSTSVYTLKFLRDGQVIWVDVDGRSGQVIGRTGR